MGFASNLKHFWHLTLAQKAVHVAKKGAKVALFASIATPLLSVAQGTYFLSTYRLSHGDAPHPASPSSGVVIVRPDHDGDIRRDKSDGLSGNWIHKIRKFFQRKTVIQNEGKDEQPLRLFVAGDSLAVGVGTSKSGTPVLPEVIARHLSKELGGRPVRWTCIGTPGASTKRITGDIKDWLESKLQRETIGGTLHRRRHTQQLQILNRDESDLLLNDPISIEQGESDSYDVVVVLTGLNDLKGIVLPFLTTDAGRNDDSFKDELRKIFLLLKEKLKWKVHQFKLKKGKKTPEDSDDGETETQHHSLLSESDKPSSSFYVAQKSPLLVLPALPTIPIPIFQYPPIGWFAHALFQCIDDEKRALSDEHPDSILFVDAPSSQLIQNIEQGTSGLCSHRKTERVILALRDIKQSAQQKIESLMKEHSLMYSAKSEENECETEKSCEEAFHLNLIRKMPAFLGSKLVSFDKIHPNDDGYDYWGRHIAVAIVDEWKARQCIEN